MSQPKPPPEHPSERVPTRSRHNGAARLFFAQLWGGQVVSTREVRRSASLVVGRDVHLEVHGAPPSDREWLLLKGTHSEWELRAPETVTGFVCRRGNDEPLSGGARYSLQIGDYGLVCDGTRAVYFALNSAPPRPPPTWISDYTWPLAIVLALLISLGGLSLLAAGPAMGSRSIPSSLLSSEELKELYSIHVMPAPENVEKVATLPPEPRNSMTLDEHETSVGPPTRWVGAEGAGTLSKLAELQILRGGDPPGLSQGFGPPLEHKETPRARSAAKLSPERIGQIIAENSGRFDSCRALAREDSHGGRMGVHWIVAPGGSVRAAQVVQSSVESYAVERCILQALQSIRFGPVNETTGASYTFSFAERR